MIRYITGKIDKRIILSFVLKSGACSYLRQGLCLIELMAGSYIYGSVCLSV